MFLLSLLWFERSEPVLDLCISFLFYYPERGRGGCGVLCLAPCAYPAPVLFVVAGLGVVCYLLSSVWFQALLEDVYARRALCHVTARSPRFGVFYGRGH